MPRPASGWASDNGLLRMTSWAAIAARLVSRLSHHEGVAGTW